MKIAIASRDFAAVSSHAGQCRQWLLYDCQPGQELVALVKASATLVLGSAEGPEYADYNRLGGTVQRVASSGGRREIVIDLGHGLTGVANAGPDLAEVFAAGQSAWLAFRPSAVLLGIPG